MSDSASAPVDGSGAALPIELMEIIIPDPFKLDGFSLPINGRWEQRWLPIKQTWTHLTNAQLRTQTADMISTLKSLSATCRTLRTLVLPRLWALVQVHSVEQLGRLREVLRASPDIAQHVKSFCFVWNIDDDCNQFPDEEGATLDLAFKDRWSIWNELRLRCGQPMEWNSDFNVWYFTHDDKYFAAPGKFPEPSSSEAASQEWSSIAARRTGGHGPDGKGEDRLIKTALQFNDCVDEIIAQLGSGLETFGWNSDVAQLPRGAFEKLEKLTNLTSLGYALTPQCHHALPLWKLAGNLQDLSLTIAQQELLEEEQNEAELVSFELPSTLPTNIEDVQALHVSIACRTVITAARGGKLKRIFADPANALEAPFAIRSLLPYWINVHEWFQVLVEPVGWLAAASTLRYLLAHASLWITPKTRQDVGKDRTLSPDIIQSFPTRFAGDEMPACIPCEAWETLPAARILPWLADAELAKQVSEAWNNVVQRGEAGILECRCLLCQVYRLEQRFKGPVQLKVSEEQYKELFGEDKSDNAAEEGEGEESEESD